MNVCKMNLLFTDYNYNRTILIILPLILEIIITAQTVSIEMLSVKLSCATPPRPNQRQKLSQ